MLYFFFREKEDGGKLIRHIGGEDIALRNCLLSASDIQWLKADDIEMVFREIQVNGFNLTIIRGDAGKKLKFQYTLPTDTLMLNYMLHDTVLNYAVNDQNIQQVTGSYTVFYRDHGSTHMELPAGTYSILQLFVSIEYMSRVNAHFPFRDSWKERNGQVATYTIDARLSECIRHIFNCKLSDVMEDNYFSLKMDELIFYLNKQLEDVNDSTKIDLGNPEAVLLYDIMHYIEANLGSTIRIDTIMSVFHLSEYKVKKLFHEAGISFTSFVTEVRMKRGMELLKTSSHKIAVIAKDTGYASASKFSNAFNKYFGILPSVVRGK